MVDDKTALTGNRIPDGSPNPYQCSGVDPNPRSKESLRAKRVVPWHIASLLGILMFHLFLMTCAALTIQELRLYYSIVDRILMYPEVFACIILLPPWHLPTRFTSSASGSAKRLARSVLIQGGLTTGATVLVQRVQRTE